MDVSGLNTQRGDVALPTTQRVLGASRPPVPCNEGLSHAHRTGACLRYAETWIIACRSFLPKGMCV
jgi:hypothetical protein